ncbi:MipA/OmpV family protein [Colwellia sp. 75C3]|uniref:MipA/OmpV family protein n=1 Tax=Colwellia sp. 75C3 TaxID=888425 RepID=UPI000C34E7F4|nr:MipA/OmpV family protein [Colwellia sp. 75C3]PKG82498.1 MipA/OmpV family protein [Colwellia sp. 75C3]
MFLRISLLFILFLSAYPSQAKQGAEQQSAAPKKEPVIEVGVGAFAMHLPQYLGSDQSDSYVVPLPYFYYLDDDFKVDRNQFTGKLWQDNNFYLDLSASGGVKVNSEDNTARTAMPDLDWVFELGPSIKYYFTGDPQKNSYLYAEFFTRKATATDFSSLTNVGWRYGPSITYQQAFSSHWINQGKGVFELTTRANVNFSDSRYSNYYYGVPSQYQKTDRQAYQSDGGYAGSDISVGLTYKVNDWWLGGFARYYYLSGAEYEASPLVKQHSNWSLGFGVAWIFYKG